MFDCDYGLGRRREGSLSERETWIFRKELRGADERRGVGRDS